MNQGRDGDKAAVREERHHPTDSLKVEMPLCGPGEPV